MICRRVFVLVIAQGVFVWAATTLAQAPAAAISQDEQALKNAGIASDGPALLAYFRRRTPTEPEQMALKQRAAQLGSSIYATRARATDDLIRAGRAALPWLRETAAKNDTETARRAQYCIQIIEQNTRLGLSAPACRLLVERNPPGALETLLAYLPFEDESWIENEICQNLKRIAYVEGRAVSLLEQALADREKKRRGAAAWLVGQSSDAAQRQRVLPLLSDESSEVRFLAASALLTAREAAAVPALIALLTSDPVDLAWRAEDLLTRVAGENGPPAWLDAANDNNGRKVQVAWELWWKSNQAKIDWKSLRLDEQSLGLTLVVENQRPDGASRMYETNASGQIRWQLKLQNPIDAQWLPGGRLLVGDSRDSTIYEMDPRGVIAWKHTGIAPTSVQRLPNGNTVVSTYRNILEITREGKIVFTYATQGHTYHARKLPDGRYVWIDAGGEIAEIDAKGKLIAKTKISSGLAWGSIEPLRNGRYLVALGGVGKVQEVDMAGKVYWEKTVNNPNRAIRLANGNTLVASHGDSAIYEFDPNGNERWKHPCVGRPFATHRR